MTLALTPQQVMLLRALYENRPEHRRDWWLFPMSRPPTDTQELVRLGLVEIKRGPDSHLGLTRLSEAGVAYGNLAWPD